MRKSKFTEQQIFGFLKLAEAGMAVAVAVAEICRKSSFSDAMFDKWRTGSSVKFRRSASN